MYRAFPHALQYDADVEADGELVVELGALPRGLDVCVELHESAGKSRLGERVVHESGIGEGCYSSCIT